MLHDAEIRFLKLSPCQHSNHLEPYCVSKWTVSEDSIFYKLSICGHSVGTILCVGYLSKLRACVSVIGRNKVDQI